MTKNEKYVSPESWIVDVELDSLICQSSFSNTITDIEEENVEW